MSKSLLFLCNDATINDVGYDTSGMVVSPLVTHGDEENVHIKISDISNRLAKHISPRLVDLLEIASCVYSADAFTPRGRSWVDGKSTEEWIRDFHFAIPVRDVDFWCNEELCNLLVKAISFLSGDKYHFTFTKTKRLWPVDGYLELGQIGKMPKRGVDRVLMFSGGLDSLAGAVETASAGNDLVLVSHRPVAMQSKSQRELFTLLQREFPSVRMIHVPVWVNKDGRRGREFTQRTRSFLFATLGGIVATSMGIGGVRFFENGVVSLNLPVAGEVLDTRASRTTHPWALSLLEKFYSIVFDKQFVIDNPFLRMTKTEIVTSLAAHGKAHLIGKTCSCAHTGFFQSKNQAHCGTCSQCIDRRIAIIKSGQEIHDPETDYVIDVFTGPRKDGYEQNMAVDYTRMANEISAMSEDQVAELFNLEITRAIRPFNDKRQAAQDFIAMYKRHGDAVMEVVNQQLRVHSPALVNGSLNNTSMLGMIIGQQHLKQSWRRYSYEIVRVLRAGLPIICQKHKPADENHLQQICDGLLVKEDQRLVREYPFLRWSSSLTKPDFSDEFNTFWVEMKYVRKREDIRPITEDIASDITKYGDNTRRTLFMVYDPQHLIVNDNTFADQILKHDGMDVALIR